jgi:hypothetical protein
MDDPKSKICRVSWHRHNLYVTEKNYILKLSSILINANQDFLIFGAHFPLVLQGNPQIPCWLFVNL